LRLAAHPAAIPQSPFRLIRRRRRARFITDAHANIHSAANPNGSDASCAIFGVVGLLTDHRLLFLFDFIAFRKMFRHQLLGLIAVVIRPRIGIRRNRHFTVAAIFAHISRRLAAQLAKQYRCKKPKQERARQDKAKHDGGPGGARALRGD
jgi:hypothetical protein